MMDCQRAASGEGHGGAVKLLRRKSGRSRQKAGRTAKEGVVALAVTEGSLRGGMVELNCETDFVARTEQYQAFAQAIAEQVAADGAADVEKVKATRYVGDPLHTVADAISTQVATIGENILLSRVGFLAASHGMQIASYLHMGGKIGVLVELSASADGETAKDVAMQVAAAEPRFVSREAVPTEVVRGARHREGAGSKLGLRHVIEDRRRAGQFCGRPASSISRL
jgi:elongation factor Ts